MHTRHIVLGIFTLFLIGCGDSPTNNNPDAGQPDATGSLSETFAGHVWDQSGTPLNDVDVSINGEQAATDMNGRFEIVLGTSDRYVIRVQEYGYVPLSQIRVGAGTSDLKLVVTPAQVIPIDPTQPVDVRDFRGTRIVLAANALVDEAGNPATEPLELHMHTYDLADEAMVGDMSAEDANGNRVALQSIGAFSADFTDEDGGRYQLAPGQTAQISMTLPGEMNFSGAAPLWHYDTERGLWIEDGVGVVQGGVAMGRVSHFSAWNFDLEFNTPACIRVELAAGLPSIEVRGKVPSLGSWTDHDFTLDSGNNVIYNIPPNVQVELYLPVSAESPTYLIDSGDPWGGEWGNPTAPYTDCLGYLYIDEVPPVEFSCSNGTDDDGDGDVDCEDSDCFGYHYCPEYCDNGIDDNGNYAVDCQDYGCYGDANCDEVCDNGVDDNGDGLVDCQDYLCYWEASCDEVCDNSVDDNGDNVVDCQDYRCTWDSNCIETCDDGVDNNGNGAVDCQDINYCYWDSNCIEDCSNGVDDNDDGTVDCQDINYCYWDSNCIEDCSNGVDDNSDGNVDCQDYRCSWDFNCSEVCDNGIDDNGNGAVDCQDEDYCYWSLDCNEICDNGADDDGDGDVDCADSDCLGDAVCQETCDNGVDDNGDGAVDCQDSDCIFDAACPESCFDTVDNDGDGFADCLDAACEGTPICPAELCGNGMDDDGDGSDDCDDSDCSGHQLCP